MELPGCCMGICGGCCTGQQPDVLTDSCMHWQLLCWQGDWAEQGESGPCCEPGQTGTGFVIMSVLNQLCDLTAIAIATSTTSTDELPAVIFIRPS